MSEGLPDLVSHVRLDTSGVAAGVAKTKAELGGLGSATSGLEKDFKGLLTSITGVGGGTSQLSGVVSKLTGSVGSARSAVTGMAGDSSKLTTALTGIGVGAAGVALGLGALAVEGIGKFTAAAGQVRSLQATLGSTAEDASKLRNVAIGLGVDVDTMGKALFKLGPILEKNKGDLAGVHVEIARNADGSTNLVGTLDNMRAAYQQLSDPLQKAQFLQEAFRKTGLDLRPVLAANADLFAKLAANGPIFNQRDLEAARNLSIAQRELKQAVDSAEIALGKGLAPTLTRIATGLTSATESASHFSADLHRIENSSSPADRALSGLVKTLGALAGSGAHPELEKMAAAHNKNVGSATAHAEAVDKLNQSLAEAQKEAKDAAAAFDRLTESQEKDLDANTAMDRALLAATRSAEAITKAELALAQAHQTVIDKQAALNKVQADGTSTADDVRSATLDLQSAQLAEKEAAEGVTDAHNSQEDALIRAAKAVRDKNVADAEASDQEVTAEQKARLFIAALRDQAGTLAPGSDLRKNLEGYADKLENGIPHEVTTTFNSNIADVGDQLDGLRQKLRELDGSKATVTVFHNNETVYHDDISHSDAAPSGEHEGGILRHFRAGGMTMPRARENHIAQIAPAGAWRVWAEDETGGEGYIPLAQSKRPRSTAVLGAIADDFGFALVRKDALAGPAPVASFPALRSSGAAGPSSGNSAPIDMDALTSAFLAALQQLPQPVIQVDRRVLGQVVSRAQSQAAVR